MDPPVLSTQTPKINYSKFIMIATAIFLFVIFACLISKMFRNNRLRRSVQGSQLSFDGAEYISLE